MFKQQQQIQSQYLFEDFKNEDSQIQKPAKLQKQELISHISSSTLLMEDNITDEKIMTGNANEKTNDIPKVIEVNPNGSAEKKPSLTQEQILELQQQYYFGTTATQSQNESPRQKSFKEEQELSLNLEEADPGDEMVF